MSAYIAGTLKARIREPPLAVLFDELRLRHRLTPPSEWDQAQIFGDLLGPLIEARDEGLIPADIAFFLIAAVIGEIGKALINAGHPRLDALAEGDPAAYEKHMRRAAVALFRLYLRDDEIAELFERDHPAYLEKFARGETELRDALNE